MARSKCPACDSTRFEMSLQEPSNSHYKINFVQCALCGTVVGVMDYFPVGTNVQDMAKQIDELKSALHTVQSSLATINNNLGQIARGLSVR